MIRLKLLLALVMLLALAPSGRAAETAPAPAFAHSAFASVWERTDALVAAGTAKRTWLWGPQPNSLGLLEEYKEGEGGTRLVQYFDKSRMEINDPAADPNSTFYVTNGLLTVELISGRMQTGKNSFVSRQPSTANVTGDPGDTLSPTYAGLGKVSNIGEERKDPDRTGQAAIATLSREGQVGQDPSKNGVPGVKIAYYEKITGHNIPQAMWDFLNSSGLVQGVTVSQERISDPWFYASGLPISDAYWTRATIAGKPTDVLLQAYERRVLTYVPTNPEGFKVEMGNIGQHYYDWRYAGGTPPTVIPGQTVTPSASATPGSGYQPLSRFAVDLNNDFSPATLDAMRNGGVGAVRFYLPWLALEPNDTSPDKYRWARYDGVLKALSDRSLQPIVVIDSCPKWACNDGHGPIRTEHLDSFAEFMGAVVERYSKAPYNVHHWEMWNEPDGALGANKDISWGLFGSQYAEMLRTIRPHVKAADPNAQIIMGGLAYDNFQETGGPFRRAFLDDVLKAGGGQYLDMFNFHYYVQNVNWCSPSAKLAELRAKLEAYKLDLPIITTETGLTSDPKFQSSDDLQSGYLVQAYSQFLGEGLRSATWFLARDFNTDVRGWQIFQKSGLLDAEGVTKPSHTAFSNLVELLGQRPHVGKLSAADGVTGAIRGYKFAADASHGGPLWVLWAWDINVHIPCGKAPESQDFAISTATASNVKRVLDMYGQPIPTRKRADGALLFSLDARPVYVEWAR